MRRLLLSVLIGAAGAGAGGEPLAAQDQVPWRASYFPYLLGNPNDGLMGIAHYQLSRQADYTSRVPFDGIFTAEGGLGTRGSRFLIVKFRAPLLVERWRFAADAGAVREGKFGYYGQGPGGQGSGIIPGTEYPPNSFRVRRTRYFVRGEVTRQVAGPLQIAAAAGLAAYRFTELAGGDAFRSDFFDTPLTGTDATGRLSLVLDTRDNEFVPGNGVLLEAGVFGGTGRFEERNASPFGSSQPYVATFSGRGYAGGYANLRGYVSPRGGTVLAGRVAIRTLGSHAPLDARYGLPGWEREVSVLGGAESQRSFVRGRFVGRGMVLSSLEIRHNLLDVGDYGAITVIAFTDAGRAFEDAAQVTLHGWKVGGGGALAFRVLRSALLTFNFAGGPDGFKFSMGNGWSF